MCDLLKAAFLFNLAQTADRRSQEARNRLIGDRESMRMSTRDRYVTRLGNDLRGASVGERKGSWMY